MILRIEIPSPGDFSYDSSQIWNSIEDCLEELCKRNKDTKRLGKSCWMIPLQGELPSIAEAVYLAKKPVFHMKRFILIKEMIGLVSLKSD